MNSDDVRAAPRVASQMVAGEPNLALQRGLKILVAVLGVLIIAGVVTIVARVVYLANKSSTQAAATRSPLAAQQELALPAGAVIRSTSLSGSRLLVHYEAPSGAGLAILDLDTGKVVSRVRVGHDPSLPW